ncbi:unnamed protein product [Gongylonema pulchrum]|uniref:Apple domain-containing protein n=1 Tax=Gongylonema pulchrum TaxID=637853 RepID=A0A183CXI2_9BILA|nr:unnamed protein product [Gongylonema pulchrum]
MDSKTHTFADCLPNFSSLIEVIDGIQVVAEALAAFQTHTVENMVCPSTLVDGSALPSACRSAHYERTRKRCFLYGTSITPAGIAQYIPNEDGIYFEKLCEIQMKCNEMMRRVPQYVLVGHATAVVDAPSHSQCVEACLRSMVSYALDKKVGLSTTRCGAATVSKNAYCREVVRVCVCVFSEASGLFHLLSTQ